MSLRALMMLLVGLLVAVALVFAVGSLQDSQATLRDASILVERNRVADHCLQAVGNFSFERGRSSVVLNGQDAINQESRRLIDQRRAIADLHLGEVLSHLSRSGLANGDKVRRAWSLVTDMRPRLELDFSLRLAERDPALPAQWLVVANDLVASLEDLLIDISHDPGNVDASFVTLSNLRLLALQFRNMVGAEASMLGAELSAGRMPNRKVIGAANQLRGRSMQIWSQLEPGTEKLSAPELVTALENVRSWLFRQFRPLQDEMIQAANRDERAPITLNRYLAASMSALDSTAELADSISQAAAGYASNRLDQARRQEMLSLASIAAILILAGLVATVLVRRLTRPLNEIVGRIDKLLRTQSGVPSPASAAVGGDEFARVNQALESLDEAMQARRRSEEALYESELISASILAGVPQSIIATDVNGLITVFSPGAENMLGYAAEEMLGKQMPYLIHLREEIFARAEELTRELGFEVKPDFDVFVAKTRTSAKPDAHEWTYVRKNGSRLTVLLSTTSLRNARGEIDGFLGVATDITERTLATARITRMAHHDQLTGLPNRRLFHDRIQMAITQARRESARLALMLIDLDKFKPVNDNYGHSVGDMLLKVVARRMQTCLRESDTLARIGGDEFVVILSEIFSEKDALGVAEKIRLALNEPFELTGGYHVSIACSVGIAIYPEHGIDEKRLLKNADDAMYTAKQDGRNRVFLYTPASGSRTKNKSGVRDLSFVRLIWHRSYKCGEVSIDQEHQELFERANLLIQAVMSDEENRKPVSRELDDLIDCVQRHFTNEEAILARRQYPGVEDHALQHQILLGRALELRNLAEAGELTLGDLVTFLVQDVVVKHMLKEDRMFYSLFRNGLSRAQPGLALGSHDSQA